MTVGELKKALEEYLVRGDEADTVEVYTDALGWTDVYPSADAPDQFGFGLDTRP